MYEPPHGVYDEAFHPGGQPRRHYAELLERLGGADLGALAARLRRRVRERRITFGGAPDGMFALDLVPRVLPRSEWGHLASGILQRARALERFTADAYGDRTVVAAGIVPERVIESSAHLEPNMRWTAPPGSWLTLVGFDLVRSPDGEFLVLEDQVRMPSGIAYAVAARECLADVLGLAPLSPAPVDATFQRLGETLRAAAPAAADDPTIVVLGEGEEADGWYEHARIARELSIRAVTAGDLERRNGELIARTPKRAAAVDVVLQRTDEDRFTDPRGGLTVLGELLLQPCREGRVSCVNAPGSGIGDDKLVHAYVERMIRFYLDEEPLLRSVASYDLGEPVERRRVLGELDEMVIKPRGTMGGAGVVIWSQASDAEREAARRRIDQAPQDFVAQRRVELSTHPTVYAGRLEPRRVDLRPYVIRSRERQWAVPGGLTRFALERGSLIVNSAQGGGVKDTWVVG